MPQSIQQVSLIIDVTANANQCMFRGQKALSGGVTLSILDDLSPFSIWEGMTIYRERMLAVLTSGCRSMTSNKDCSLYPPSINQSGAARSPTPTRLASAGDLSACCQLGWEQEGGTVAALVADALSTGRQDRRAITHEGVDAGVEVLLVMDVGDVVALDSSRALASAASLHRGRSALLANGDWPL